MAGAARPSRTAPPRLEDADGRKPQRSVVMTADISPVKDAAPIVRARGLTKRYGATAALDHVDLDIRPGCIVGLIGPNGAGKTTALKAILGLTEFDGELSVLGMDPRSQRTELMQQVCFIADVAVLPRWLRVAGAVDFVAAVHPRFSRDKC